MPSLMHAMGAVLAVYTLSQGCQYARQTPIPFTPGTPVIKEENYLVWTESEKMILPGYELSRRPPEMTLEQFLEKEKLLLCEH